MIAVQSRFWAVLLLISSRAWGQEIYSATITESAPPKIQVGMPETPPARISGEEEVESQFEIDAYGKGVSTLFRLGNESYERDRLEEAAAYYQSILARGVENGDLFFNLANAYFRMGDFGRAILFYERAKKLRPRDEDVRHNLAYTRTFVIDKHSPEDRLPGSLETILILHRQTTLNETLWILASLNLAACALFLGTALGLRVTNNVFYGYIRGAVVTLLALQVTSASHKIWFEENKEIGVVLSDNVQAKAAPTADETLFELNSGTMVEILEQRGGLAHIRWEQTPAFIPAEDVGKV